MENDTSSLPALVFTLQSSELAGQIRLTVQRGAMIAGIYDLPGWNDLLLNVINSHLVKWRGRKPGDTEQRKD